jgi:glycosyltransferase involved in cell wall biosynthesis
VSWVAPEKVLITGGREVGGIASFAEALRGGFAELGVPSEVVPPRSLLSRTGELRSGRILKLLSTTGMLAVPFARRVMCVAHTVPLAREQGWPKLLVLISCFKLTNAYPSARIVAVSDYVAMQLTFLFNIRIDGTVRNPLPPVFLEAFDPEGQERNYLTFVGRLVPCKRVELLLPPICDLLAENPQLRCCIVGDGPERRTLEEKAAGNSRIEFVGSRDYSFVRDQLRRSKLFISGAGNEGFGIAYLEALSQGCIVAMPAAGGGMEIALRAVGQNVHLLPISLERGEVLRVLRQALTLKPPPICLEAYVPRRVASAYLDLDRQFFAKSAWK